MKLLISLPFIFFATIIFNKAAAQNNTDARALVKQGMGLNDKKDYAGAIAKYNQALKADTGYLYANYQLAYSLFLADRGKEGIPYLQKVIKGDEKLSSAAYDLLSLIYFKNRRYGEAEQSAIEAIKLNPKYPGTQRTYALVCFHQNKRAAALLGFCSFILLEPNSPRSAEAYGNIQHILQGGNLKPEPGEMVSHAIEANTNALNIAITNAVAETSKRRYATAGDLLTAQLKGIFTNIGQLADKQTGNDFFKNYLAGYFFKMAQSTKLPAFARLISQSTPESAKWIKDNPKQMEELNEWVKGMQRSF